MTHRSQSMALVLSLGALIALGILLTSTAAANSQPIAGVELHVCPTLEAGCDHTSIQSAVDAALPGAVIKVAAGLYTGLNVHEGVTQTVRIDKSLSLQGGYTPANWSVPEPEVHVTTVDAQGQGIAILVDNAGPVTITGLDITAAGPADVAGVLVSGGQVSISDCTIHDNWRGVKFLNASGTVSSCTIASNTLESFMYTGGAGVVIGSSRVTLRGNTIRDNVVRTTGEGGGSVYVYDSTITLEGNTITGNVANETGVAKGGGIYLEQSDGTITGNTITNNVARAINIGIGYGGGVYVYESTVAIDDNIIDDNVAASAPGAVGRGGGLYIKQSDGTTLTGNQIRGNVASAEMRGTGGGLVVNCSEITLTANLIAGNYANATSTYPGWGGGLFLDKTTPEWRTLTLIGNIISGNVAAARGEGEGGGLYLSLTPVRLFGNRIEGNIASIEMPGRGGGIYLDSPGMGPLQGNVISGNVASMADDGFGGGIYLDFADRLLLAENTIVGNAATQDPGAASQGGGIYMRDSVPITLTNNVVTGNRAYDQGSGLWFDGFPYNPAVRVSMLHTTLADNGGCGQGLYVGDTTILTLTNTIVAGHNDAGIRVSQGSTVTLEATLWFSNGIHLDSAGHVSAGAINIYDDPAFAGGGDYHLTAGSAARDAGVPCGLAIDIDGRLRPIGPAPDLGADEFAYPNYLPLAIKES